MTMPQLQPVAVRMLALLVLASALGGAATAYVRPGTTQHDKAATSNVRAAAAAAESWFQDPLGGSGSYRRLTTSRLVHQAPAVSPHVHVTVLAGGAAFCLDDVEAPGRSAFYVGGNVARVSGLGAIHPSVATLVHSQAVDAAAVCRSLS
ncbi:MAG: hypothetical protein ACRDL2_05655 [Gaiellaceae bacterium]